MADPDEREARVDGVGPQRRETRGRKRGGQLREYAIADGTRTWSMRLRWRGTRLNVRLGNELEGWSRALAELTLRQTLAQIEAGIWQPPIPDIPDDERDPTFHEFATVWFDRHVVGLDDSTKSSYSLLLSRYILPEFKDHRLTQITYESVLRWRDRLRKESEQLRLAKDNGVILFDRHERPRRPFGPKTINDALRLLGQVVHRAVESEHYLLDRNPVRGRSGLRLKTPARPPREHLEADEVLTMIHAADLLDQGVTPHALIRADHIREQRDRGISWRDIASGLQIAESTVIYQSRIQARESAARQRRAMICVLALSGVRASELTELTWKRIDHTHGRIVLEDAKTPAGVREIYLSPFLRIELDLYRTSLGLPPQPDSPVFPVRAGGPSDRFNLGRRLKTIAAVATQLRTADGLAPLPVRITPHSFRRTFITLSFQVGRDVVFVQTQAGHADWKTTLNVYTQQSGRSVDPRIRALLDTFFGDHIDASHGDTTTLHDRRTVL